MKNGWPPDTAMDLDDEYRQAFTIIYGIGNGGNFNWNKYQFEKAQS